MDPLQKVTAGQPFQPSAITHNAFIDAARYVRAQMEASEDSPGTLGLHRQSGIVTVRNESGTDLKRYAVLGVDGSVIDPATDPELFRKRVVLSGVTPTDDHVGQFVVLLDSIAAGAIGRAFIDGVCPVQVNVIDANDQWADVKSGEASRLTSYSSGAARILYKQSGTGNKLAVVRLGNEPSVIPVDLTQTGGSAGNSTTECSYTYTISRRGSGETLATAVALAGHRPANAAMLAGTKGLAMRDGDGTWVLVSTDERFDQTNCPAPP